MMCPESPEMKMPAWKDHIFPAFIPTAWRRRRHGLLSGKLDKHCSWSSRSIVGRELYKVQDLLLWFGRIYSYELSEFLHFPEYELIRRVCSKSRWCCYLAQDYLSFSLPLQEARIRFDDLMSLSHRAMLCPRRRLESCPSASLMARQLIQDVWMSLDVTCI